MLQPYVELKRFHQSNGVYFITTTVRGRRPTFSRPENARILLSTLDKVCHEACAGVIAYAVLPDHLHLMLRIATVPLTVIMKRVKGVSARLINTRSHPGSLWQHQYMDHVLRNNDDYRRHIEYIHSNPVKHGLVDKPSDYRWTSWHDYHGKDGGLIRVHPLY